MTLSYEEMVRVNYCAQQLTIGHGEAKYWVLFKLHGDPTRQIMFKLCEECSLLIRTHPDLITIKSIPREPVTS